MIKSDIEYVKKVLKAGLLKSPCLELGVGYGGENNKSLIQNAGIKYFGTDMVAGEYVDFITNFENTTECVEKTFENVGKFGSILVLNVLEHTFDPIRILDNIFNILQPEGTCIIITPTVWPLHDYPYDCWRINPNFYEEYCKRRDLHLLDEYFEYVGFHNVKINKDTNGTYVLPKPSQSKLKEITSRTIHKVFNTYGRSMFFPSHIATGVVIKK